MNPEPFSRRAVLAMVVLGAAAFLLLLYGLATSAGGSGNDGGGHVAGRGLNGFAALARMLEEDGIPVRQVRNKAGLAEPGLLILTPPDSVDIERLNEVVEARRRIGPTLIIHPKWRTVPSKAPAARRGWVKLAGTSGPDWPDFHDEIGWTITTRKDPRAGGWRAGGRKGPLPDDAVVEVAGGAGLLPLVTTGRGQTLAAFTADKGHYPALYALAGAAEDASEREADLFPLVFVFEPDLLDNWGLKDRATALLARDLVLAASGGKPVPVTFDMTFNGFAHARSLLDLAFRPPFLAATLCFLMAALAVGWRAFARFGPARRGERPMALGKAALVDNGAGLIVRAGRLRLVAEPFVSALAARTARAIGLRVRDANREAALDAAMARRGLPGPRFSETATALRAARNPSELARHARQLQTTAAALAAREPHPSPPGPATP